MPELPIYSFLYDFAGTPVQPEKRPAVGACPIRSECDCGFCLAVKCFVVFIARRFASQSSNLEAHALRDTVF